MFITFISFYYQLKNISDAANQCRRSWDCNASPSKIFEAKLIRFGQSWSEIWQK